MVSIRHEQTRQLTRLRQNMATTGSASGLATEKQGTLQTTARTHQPQDQSVVAETIGYLQTVSKQLALSKTTIMKLPTAYTWYLTFVSNSTSNNQ